MLTYVRHCILYSSFEFSFAFLFKEPPSTQWKRDVTGLVDTQFVREGLNPNQEYHFRVKAETEYGSSDPTLPLIIRGKGKLRTRECKRVLSTFK